MRPPYDHYQAKPSVVRSYADSIITKAASVKKVDTDALEQKASAAENVTGELADKLDEPFQNISKDADQISLASAFVAGSLYTWASAITTFNNGVDGLNTEWSNRQTGPSGGLSPAAIEQQIIKELNKKWQKLDVALDDSAQELETELGKGPDKASVLEYFATGALPESAFPLLSAVGIDPKKAKSILADLRTFLDESGKLGVSEKRMDAWYDMLDTIKEMDPKAAAVIMGALSDEELKALGDEIGGVSESHMNSATDFYSFLLSGATREQVDRMKELWDLNPADGENWSVPYRNLFNPPYDGNNGTTIGAKQGDFNDCWVFAKLNALVEADPSWPQQHVRDNGNGTVSVKFYDGDGSPYWVTVTDELPSNGAQPEGINSSTWAAYYEKAMATDDHGADGILGGDGYDGLTAGWSDSADVYMTGKESDNVKYTSINPWADPYSEVKEAVADGKGVVASNWSNSPLPWNDEDDDLVQYHVYYVKEIDGDGNVVLGNPWGHSDVTLSPGDFNDYMEDVSIVNQ